MCIRDRPQGFYGLLLRAVWQKGEENLTYTEIDEYAAGIADNLAKTLGVQQRV